MSQADKINMITETLEDIFLITEYLVGHPADQDTVYNFADNMWLGHGYYQYINSDGNASNEQGTCIFNPNALTPGATVFAGPHVTARAQSTSMTGTPASLTYNNASMGINGGSYYTFWIEVDGEQVFNNSGIYNARMTNRTAVTFTAGNPPSYNYPAGNVGAVATVGSEAYIDSTILTTSGNMHSDHPNMPYVQPGQYSFNDLRNQMILQVNLDFGMDIPLDSPEIPELEDLLEETNPPATGDNNFYIDYDQILSPEDLENILQQETYELQELPTFSAEDLGSLTLPELPEETLSSNLLAVIPAGLNASISFFDSMGLTSTLIATAVIIVVIKMLKGG